MKRVRVMLGLLLLICCGLWVASYWWINWHSLDLRLIVQIRHGFFWIGRYEPTGLDFNYGGTGVPDGLIMSGFDDLTTFWWPVAWVFYDHGWSLSGTFWLPTLLLALSLAYTFNPWSRRKRRAKQGLCIRCGYDLQGGKHEHCPECGHAQQPPSRPVTPP